MSFTFDLVPQTNSNLSSKQFIFTDIIEDFEFTNIEHDALFKNYCELNILNFDDLIVWIKKYNISNLVKFKEYLVEYINKEPNSCPTFQSMKQLVMRNYNIIKHIKSCNLCEMSFDAMKRRADMHKRYIGGIVGWYQCKSANDIIKNHRVALDKICDQIFSYIKLNYIKRTIQLNTDNIKNIQFTINGHNTIISLEDIYESILMNTAKESFDQKLSK